MSTSSARTFSSIQDRLTLPADEALRWAVVDELPKRRYDPPLSRIGSTSDAIATYGVAIDNWSQEPGMPLAIGDPHPDALLIEEALRGLKAGDLDLRPYDIGRGLGPDCNAAKVEAHVKARPDLIGRLIRLAIRRKPHDVGEGPMCEAAKGYGGKITLWLEEEEVVGKMPDGRPIIVTADKHTTPLRAGVYRPGTFCKLHWIRNAEDVAEDRALYALDHAALVRVADIVRDDLRYIAIRPPKAPPTPWIADPEPPRTLLSLVSVNHDFDRPRATARTSKETPSAPVRQVEPAPSATRLAA